MNKPSKIKQKAVRKGGQLKGTKHRGELQTYYELLKLLEKKELRKSEIKEKLRTDGVFIKKAMLRLEKKLFIQATDDSRQPKYRITTIGMKFYVYLGELVT